MYKLLFILFIFVSLILISIILFQDNDEIDITSSNTKSPFNTNMSNKILTRSIIFFASLFFIISLTINNFNVKKYSKTHITSYNISKI